tara:strand:- start:489 stop:902 length:414 start_codon:yes stop_codon:yes gene_type:complete
MSKDGDRQVGVGTAGQDSCVSTPINFPWDATRRDKGVKATYQRKAQKAPDDSHLRNAMEVTGLSDRELSVAMGLSDGTVVSWLKNGNIPLWSVLAVDGMLSKYQTEDALFAVALRHDQQDTVRAVLVGLGCKVARIK